MLASPAEDTEKPKVFRFTKENAKEYSARANKARWHDKPIALGIAEKTADESKTRARVERLEKQLDAIDDAIDAGGLKASDWRDLTAARERLFKQWQVLANIPNPGNLKPTAKRRTAASSSGPEPAPE